MGRRTEISLLACAFGLGLAGCGSGDGTIPPRDADDLLTQLAAVQNDVADGNCDLAEQHAQEVVNEVNALPGEVDPKVAGALTKAASNLVTLAADPSQCTDTGASGELGAQSTTSTTTTTATPATSTDASTTEEPTTDEQGGGNQGQGAGQGSSPPAGNQGGQGGGNAGGVEPPSGGVTGGGNAGKR